MKKIKRGISVLLISMFFTPQFLSASASEIAGKNIGEKYEKRIVSSMARERLSSGKIKYTDNDEKLTEEELRMLEQSYKDKETYKVLVPKTDSNYEVALSYEDGSYIYVESADTYDEAVEKAKLQENLIEKTKTSGIVVPTVINNEGITVYAELSIARSWKEGKDSAGTVNSYVYSDSDLKNIYTYISDGYISEMPIIEENQNEVKVLVSGYEGWMNKNPNRIAEGYRGPNKDVRIQPITDVTNPCYYTVSEGKLIHKISTSMTGKSVYGKTIGIAPEYLNEGQRYYSYDGNYFYDGSQGIATGLSNLTRDLQSRSHGRAVNANNPYYNYYSYLPFRSKTNYTEDELNNYINYAVNNYKRINKISKDSRLIGLGGAFIRAQEAYGVNALLALGVAMNESAYGTSDYALNRNNLFGLNATDDNTDKNASYYSSPEDCINEFAKNYISREYADPNNWCYYGGFLGNKKYGANVRYAADPYWAEKAISHVVDAEFYLSGNDVNRMKDYNYYQLLMHNNESNVFELNGNILYPIQLGINAYSSNVGAVAAFTGGALRRINGFDCYEIYAERTSNIKSGRFVGNYDWGTKGYINANAVKPINVGKNWFKAEDLNMDSKISVEDLALLGNNYNLTMGSSGWNNRYDINSDGIIDIYDMVRVSYKLQ